MNKSIAALSIVAAALLSTSAVHAEDIFYSSGWYFFPDAQDAQTDSNFGWTLYTHENLLFVGTSDGVDSEDRSFLVYDTNDWSVVMRISPDTPDAEFGRQIAIDDSRIWISGTDAIYTFDLLTGDQLHTFVEPETDTHGRYGDSFAVEDGMLYVGDLVAPNADAPPSTLGVVYIYETETNTLVDTLVTPNTSGADGFGTNVRADENYLCVAAPFATYAIPMNPGSVTNRGIVYVYDRTTLELIRTLRTENTHEYGQSTFGPEYILENGRVLVQMSQPGCQSGSYPEYGVTIIALHGVGSGGAWSGDCYGDTTYESMYAKDGIVLLDRRNSNPFETFHIHNIQIRDWSGTYPAQPEIQLEDTTSVSQSVEDISLAYSSRYLFAGLPTAEDGEGFGRVVVIEATCNYEFRKADINDDNVVDVFDVFGFLDLWSAHDPEADLVPNGVWDVFDVFAYLEYFSEACE